jgi:hypothetical protein
MGVPKRCWPWLFGRDPLLPVRWSCSAIECECDDPARGCDDDGGRGRCGDAGDTEAATAALELDTGRRSLGPGPRGGCGEPASSVDSDEEDEEEEEDADGWLAEAAPRRSALFWALTARARALASGEAFGLE